MKFIISLGLLLSLCPSAFAEEVTFQNDKIADPIIQSSKAVRIPQQVEKSLECPEKTLHTLVIPEGTLIPITLNNTISSDNLKTGDMISAGLSESVSINGMTLFRKGSNGVLYISKSIKSAGHGKPGELEITSGRIVDIYGNQYPLQLSVSSKGIGKRKWAITSSIVGMALILTPFGIWIEGTPATLQGGLVVEAFTKTRKTIEISAEAKERNN